MYSLMRPIGVEMNAAGLKASLDQERHFPDGFQCADMHKDRPEVILEANLLRAALLQYRHQVSSFPILISFLFF